jgi:glutathione S-transferase
MQQPHSLTTLVTVAALLVYIWMGIRVARARRRCGIHAPAMTGDPVLERTIRAHLNTLEWLPPFLAGLWLFSIYWNDRLAAILGVIWIAGRVLYALTYSAGEAKRLPGFLIQTLVTLVLLIGAAIGAIRVMSVTGGL